MKWVFIVLTLWKGWIGFLKNTSTFLKLHFPRTFNS